ncbi:modulator of DNA gyrase family protein, partial [Vibrio parahaemolyticus V-223/04]
CLKQMV